MQKAVIDYSENPALGAYAKSKSAGDSCSFKLKGKFISAAGGKIVFNVKEIEYEYEDEKTTVKPDLDEPVSLAVIEVSDAEEESSKEGQAEISNMLLYGEDEETY